MQQKTLSEREISLFMRMTFSGDLGFASRPRWSRLPGWDGVAGSQGSSLRRI